MATSVDLTKTAQVNGNSLVASQSLTGALQSLVSGGPVGVHVYGNSFAAAQAFSPSFTASSDGRLYIVKNSGVGGFRSDQVLAKLQAEGIEPEAKILLYIEGTNDAAQSIPAATHAANMKAIADYAISRNVVPVMCVTAPRDTSFIAETNLNAITDQMISIKYGIPAFDSFSKWVDQSDGSWAAGASADGVHPTQSVYTQSGQELYNLVFNRKPCMLVPRTNAGNGQFGSNVLNLTDSNADGLPDGWQALNLTGQTYPVMQDYSFPYRGKRARLSMSQAASGGTLYRILSKAGKFNDGDEIAVAGVFNVEAVSGARITIFVRAQSAGVADIFLGAYATTSTDQYLQARFKVPNGTTDLRLFIKFDAADGAANHSATIGYGCWDFYNITTQSLV